MTIDILQTLDVIEAMESFLSRKGPPADIRHKVDLGYKMDNQSIVIFEIRPRWDNPSEIMELPVAKTTYVKRSGKWKVFWMRGNLKWENYSPAPTVKILQEFTNIVEEDKYHCFWG